MLWHLLASNGGYCSPYSLPLRQKVNSSGVHSLDTISCAGGANMQALRTRALTRGLLFAVTLMNIILVPAKFQDTLLEVLSHPQGGRKVYFTNERYRPHFLDLNLWGLIPTCPIEEVKSFSTYFSVEKNCAGKEEGISVHDRAIFNGKKLSVGCKIPPLVNLPDMCEVLQRIANLSRPDGVSIICGDLRHWFHQIPVSPVASS